MNESIDSEKQKYNQVSEKLSAMYLKWDTCYEYILKYLYCVQ